MIRLVLVVVATLLGQWAVAGALVLELVLSWWWRRPSRRARGMLGTQQAGLARMRIYLHAVQTASALGLDREALGVLLVQMGNALERGRAVPGPADKEGASDARAH